MSDEPVHFVWKGAVSKAAEMMDDATVLIAKSRELGTTEGQTSSNLAACSVLLAAAGLEQVLEEAVTFAQADKRMRPPDDGRELEEAVDKSLRWKLVHLPRLIWGGQFEVARQHPVLAQLHRLIDTRNRLVHRRDEIYVIQGADDPNGEQETIDVQMPGFDMTELGLVGGSTVRGRVIGRSGITMLLRLEGQEEDVIMSVIPVPENPWRSISPDQAMAHLEAVNTYLDECVFTDAPGGKSGLLVTRR